MATDVATQDTRSAPKEASALAEWFFYAGLGLMVIAAVASVFMRQHSSLRGAFFGAGVLLTIVTSIILWMPHLFTLIRRELGAYFLSPIAYMVLVGLCLVAAWNFFEVLLTLRLPRIEFSEAQNPIFHFMGANIWLLFCLLIIPGIVTMRLFSEERRSGSIELLLTAPLSEIEVVIAKFISALVFYMILWLPWALYLCVLYQHVQFDYWKILASYLCLLTIGCPFIAGGLFFSSLTRNQIISFILSFAWMVLFLAIVVGQSFAQGYALSQKLVDVLRYCSFWIHMNEFGQGRVDLRIIVFHLSIAVVLLFGTVVLVRNQKWK